MNEFSRLQIHSIACTISSGRAKRRIGMFDTMRSVAASAPPRI
jgi:hypothetical protein